MLFSNSARQKNVWIRLGIEVENEGWEVWFCSCCSLAWSFYSVKTRKICWAICSLCLPIYRFTILYSRYIEFDPACYSIIWLQFYQCKYYTNFFTWKVKNLTGGSRQQMKQQTKLPFQILSIWNRSKKPERIRWSRQKRDPLSESNKDGKRKRTRFSVVLKGEHQQHSNSNGE